MGQEAAVPGQTRPGAVAPKPVVTWQGGAVAPQGGHPDRAAAEDPAPAAQPEAAAELHRGPPAPPPTGDPPASPPGSPCPRVPPWTRSKPALPSASARRGRAPSRDKGEPPGISPGRGVGREDPRATPRTEGSGRRPTVVSSLAWAEAAQRCPHWPPPRAAPRVVGMGGGHPLLRHPARPPRHCQGLGWGTN